MTNQEKTSSRPVRILDGGTGRELLRIGAPFRQPEWSALALLDGPEWVVQAHRNFIDAGATIITTNSYACVPFHLGQDRFDARGPELAALSGELAREAVGDAAPGKVAVAGSIPPVSGSYRPDLFKVSAAERVVSMLVEALSSTVDHWLIETTSSVLEAETALRATAATGKTSWVSFTLEDHLNASGQAVLRSGESIHAAIDKLGDRIDGLLFNCSQPEVMGAAVSEAAASCGATVSIGVYANAFPLIQDDATANEVLLDIRADLGPDSYVRFAQEWVAQGATIIGGCCGITPAHIKALAAANL